MIYFQMARFLWEEKRDYLHVGRAAARMELANWKEAGLLDLGHARIEITTAGAASCPACRALAGRIFTYDEALTMMPLPVPECTNEKGADHPRGWCRCDWVLLPRFGTV